MPWLTRALKHLKELALKVYYTFTSATEVSVFELFYEAIWENVWKYSAIGDERLSLLL